MQDGKGRLMPFQTAVAYQRKPYEIDLRTSCSEALTTLKEKRIMRDSVTKTKWLKEEANFTRLVGYDI